MDYDFLSTTLNSDCMLDLQGMTIIILLQRTYISTLRPQLRNVDSKYKNWLDL